ncbi:MAG: hypothetical protein J3Q66DRAFT_400083 [Benniella sp.]|nr:MAG: hypothetical protein J3Q66DRAFT_400083 [Benniella sp.]
MVNGHREFKGKTHTCISHTDHTRRHRTYMETLQAYCARFSKGTFQYTNIPRHQYVYLSQTEIFKFFLEYTRESETKGVRDESSNPGAQQRSGSQSYSTASESRYNKDGSWDWGMQHRQLQSNGPD